MGLRAALLIIAAGGIIASPLRAFGHGSEFMLAKVLLARDGSVQLEVTADYGENPMLSSEVDARAALTGLLEVRGVGPVEKVAPPRFEARTRYDNTSPLPRDPAAEDKPHQLVTTVSRWKPDAESIVFEVPRNNPHNVVLWTVDEREPQAARKWVMLIAGDHSPAIAVPKPARWPLISAGVACLSALGIAMVFKRTRNRATLAKA